MSISEKQQELFNRRSAAVCRTLHELCPDRLPVEIRSMFCPEPDTGKEDPWHVHTYLEIRYVLSGTALWEVPGRCIEAAEGELLLIPAMQFHRRLASGSIARVMGFRAYIPEKNTGMASWRALTCGKYALPRPLRREIPEMIRLTASGPGTGELEAAFLLGRIVTGISELCLREMFPAAEQENGEVHKGSWEFRNQVYQSALQYINDNLSRSLSVEEIAAHCYVSPRHLTRIFLQICGVTPGKKITRCRIDRAFILLSESKSSIRTIAEILGFADVSHFCRVFRHAAALTPNEYRRQLSSLNRQGMSAVHLISAPVQQTNKGRKEQ